MAHHDKHEEHHVVPLAVFYKVFAALIFLTVVTVATAKGLDLGPYNGVLAFAIATGKGLLVLAFFMHLKYDEKIYKIIIGCSFLFVLLLYVICVFDIYTR